MSETSTTPAMINNPRNGVPHNPFSSEHVCPGAIPWQPADASVAQLWTTFDQLGRRAQIVGPHGTGKTTLLHHLGEHARATGLQVCHWNAADGRPQELPPGGLLVLDSGERLSRFSHWRLHRACRAAACGLLVASHRNAGLPTLRNHVIDVRITRSIVEQLLNGWPVAPPSEEHLGRLLHYRQGNLRLVLFDLYDWYEEQAKAIRGS